MWPGASVVTGLISLKNNLITNLYHSGNYHPQSCIKNVFLRRKMCCLWHPSQPQEFHFMIDPSSLSLFFFFFSSFLYFFQISQYSQPTLSLPSSAVKKLPNIVVCPQHYLLGLAKRTHFSQLRPLRFPRLLLSPDPRIPHESQKPQVAQSHPWGPRPFAVYLQLFNDKASLEETHSSKEAFLITPLQPPPYSLTSSSASWPLSPNPRLFFFTL